MLKAAFIWLIKKYVKKKYILLQFKTTDFFEIYFEM